MSRVSITEDTELPLQGYCLLQALKKMLPQPLDINASAGDKLASVSAEDKGQGTGRNGGKRVNRGTTSALLAAQGLTSKQSKPVHQWCNGSNDIASSTPVTSRCTPLITERPPRLLRHSGSISESGWEIRRQQGAF
ncbi:hypothetical protein JOB18_016453 [Solea senegalensis]|uniref:Uncharacterized protein n=1 Tax=Solea senegalensis TaxID=28829 RepID=A0AAV6SLU4_SOLSE|nr:hypothetical protein JOB18_016453 [Solea senegalensis]